MATVDMYEMIKVVEAYILEKKGRRVQIEFNNIQRFPVHLEMLVACYNYIKNEGRDNNTK
jgi:hypothetical protein